MNVVFACDNNYVPLLTISAVSFLVNNQNDFDEINIFILDDGISESNKNKVNSILSEYKCNISFIKTKKIEELDFKVLSLEREDIASLTTYARLFIPSLLPDDVDKLLYLDCDSIIVDSFKQLWQEDISDYYCAAVQDCSNTSYMEALGIPRNEKYYNAGVLLINLEKWREDNVENQFMEFLTDNQQRYYQHDQGVLNNIFKNKIKTVSPKYNLQGYFQFLDYNLSRKYACIEIEYYSREIMDDARKNPVFLHFCAADYFRPWKNPNHPYFKEFEYYADLAGFKDVIDYSTEFNSKQLMFQRFSQNKLGSILLNLVPASMVRKVINKNAFRELDEEVNKAKELK